MVNFGCVSILESGGHMPLGQGNEVAFSEGNKLRIQGGVLNGRHKRENQIEISFVRSRRS